MPKMETISEKELIGCMTFIKEMRIWAALNNVDPFAIRQALLTALHIDTKVALARGIKHKDLQIFDQTVRQDIGQWLKKHVSKES